MDVIVLGSINMDIVIETDKMPEQGETIAGKDFFLSHGGKGANQATAIGKMGLKPKLIGCVGDDVYGKDLLNTLSKNNVDVSHVDIKKQYPSGVAVIILHNKDNRIIIHHGANHYVDTYKVDALIEEAEKHSIFLSQLENDQALVEHSVIEAKSKGLYTIVNPSPFKPLKEEVYKSIDLLVLNESESKQLLKYNEKTKFNVLEACKNILKLGISSVVLTMGSEGSYVYDGITLTHIDRYTVNVVDTTCAGDSFLGAMIYQLAHKKSIIESVRFAAKIAAITISKKGAQDAIPTFDEYQALEDEGFFN